MPIDPHEPTLDADSGVASVDATMDAAGTVLAGRYELLGLLGVGGMGAVYRAHDAELDDEVALKMLRPAWIESSGALARFRREVKIARRVTHRNVARTFDIGQDGASRFLTMELIDGPSLARRLEDEGALPVDEALRIAREICDGLDAAHAAGVVHRDLKPDNVLLAEDRVVVTDFGIARVERSDSAATGAALLGTPAYMAPEQVLGKTADARADLYALGLVLYEMLTGARAFTGETPLGVASARLVEPPPDPSRHVGRLPDGLADLVRQLLCRDPSGRPDSAAEVRAALDAIVVQGPASLRPPDPAQERPEIARSLAVLSIAWSGDEAERWIADGFGEDLEDSLCMARGLKVRAGGAPREGEDARAFGHRLGVELVLHGSLRRAGDGVRVRLRLTSVEDGFHVWADRYACALGDLLVTSDRAAQAVAGAAGRASLPSLGRAEVPAEAVELYLKARRALELGPAVGDGEAASSLMTRAHALAPADPGILSGLAIALVREGYRPPGTDAATLEVARAHAERALELAPHLAEPWLALARVRHGAGDTPGAIRALRRALKSGPSVAEAQAFAARLLTELGRFDEARRYADRALWLDPTLGFVHFDLLRHDAIRADWDAVEARLADMAEAFPELAALSGPRLSLWAGRRLLPEELVDRVGPDARVMLDLAEGDLDPSARLDALERLIAALDPVSLAARMFNQLRVELLCGARRPDEAMPSVEASVRAGLEDLPWMDGCPLLAPLRGRPDFTALRERVAARAERALLEWDGRTSEQPTMA
ncbi:MAG: protein kinase [Sandaracinaceae bacterium]|nr:protein kinase [Sandaracinaceae bacterium]